MIQLFQRFQRLQNKDFYKNSHGLEILRVLACDILDDMNMLTQENFNKIETNNFLHHVTLTLKQQNTIQSLTVDDLKKFLSYAYFMLQRNICNDYYKEIISTEMVKNYLEGNVVLHDFACSDDQQDSQIEQIQNEEQKNQVQEKESSAIEEGQIFISENSEQQKDEFQYENDCEEIKQKYFNYLVEESQFFPNPLSEVNNILYKYSNLKYHQKCLPIRANENKNQLFQYNYQCVDMQIPPIFSEPKISQQEAKSQAAKKLLPHLQFFDRYKHAYEKYIYEIDDNENQQNTNNNIDEEEFQAKIIEDLLIYTQCDNEVSAVLEILQKQLGQEYFSALQGNEFRTINGLYQYNLTFTIQGQELVKVSAIGKDKKMAKEIAYYKIKNDIKKYFYELNASYYKEFEEEKPKKEYRRRKRGDDNEENN